MNKHNYHYDSNGLPYERLHGVLLFTLFMQNAYVTAIERGDPCKAEQLLVGNLCVSLQRLQLGPKTEGNQSTRDFSNIPLQDGTHEVEHPPRFGAGREGNRGANEIVAEVPFAVWDVIAPMIEAAPIAQSVDTALTGLIDQLRDAAPRPVSR